MCPSLMMIKQFSKWWTNLNSMPLIMVTAAVLIDFQNREIYANLRFANAENHLFSIYSHTYTRLSPVRWMNRALCIIYETEMDLNVCGLIVLRLIPSLELGIWIYFVNMDCLFHVCILYSLYSRHLSEFLTGECILCSFIILQLLLRFFPFFSFTIKNDSNSSIYIGIPTREKKKL